MGERCVEYCDETAVRENPLIGAYLGQSGGKTPLTGPNPSISGPIDRPWPTVAAGFPDVLLNRPKASSWAPGAYRTWGSVFNRPRLDATSARAETKVCQHAEGSDFYKFWASPRADEELPTVRQLVERAGRRVDLVVVGADRESAQLADERFVPGASD